MAISSCQAMQVAANFAASIFLMSKLDFHFHSSFCVGCKIVISVCVCFFLHTSTVHCCCSCRECTFWCWDLPTLYPLFIPQEQQLSVTAAFTSAQYGAIKLCTCLCLGLKLNTFVVEQITIDLKKRDKQQSSVTATIKCLQGLGSLRPFLLSG